MTGDLTFRTDHGRFNYRVGAIILHEGKLLMMKNTEAPYIYSVGGRVRYDETTEEAVVREIMEETGVRMDILRPLVFQEQFFKEEVTGEHVHEIAVYYLMQDSEALDHLECHSVTERGAKEELIWISPDELEKYNFVPVSVGKVLRELPEQMLHIIERDE